MSFRLSCRRFLLFVKERSGLRGRMKSRKMRCESREGIQEKKKANLYGTNLYRSYRYRTYLYAVELAAEGCDETRKPQASVET